MGAASHNLYVINTDNSILVICSYMNGVTIVRPYTVALPMIRARSTVAKANVEMGVDF